MPKAVIKDEGDLKEKEEVPEETDDEIDPVSEELSKPLTLDQDPDEGEVEDDSQGVPLESLDPKEELWDDGPTVAQALEWKDKFGRLYITSLDYDDHILWRPLMRSEYKEHVRQIERMTSSGQVSQLEAKLLNEELLAETCMLWPRYDKAAENYAGIPAIISDEIMEASGFVALQVRQL